MFLKLSLLLMGLGISLAYKHQLSWNSYEKINKLHSDHMMIAEDHKDFSSICFPIYNPELSALTTKYELEYDTCISAYEVSRAVVDNTYKDTRLQMEISSYSSCQSLESCQKSLTTLDVFECTAAKASEDAKIFYDISTKASVAAAKSKSDYTQVEATKSICVSEAERTYVENTSNIYGLLNSCLLGNHPVGF